MCSTLLSTICPKWYVIFPKKHLNYLKNTNLMLFGLNQWAYTMTMTHFVMNCRPSLNMNRVFLSVKRKRALWYISYNDTKKMQVKIWSFLLVNWRHLNIDCLEKCVKNLETLLLILQMLLAMYWYRDSLNNHESYAGTHKDSITTCHIHLSSTMIYAFSLSS